MSFLSRTQRNETRVTSVDGKFKMAAGTNTDELPEQEKEWLASVTETFKQIAGEDNKINTEELKKAMQVKDVSLDKCNVP